MPLPIIILLGALVVIPLGIVAVLYLIVPFFKAIGWVVRQVFRFIGGELGDAMRIVGALVTRGFLIPLGIINVPPRPLALPDGLAGGAGEAAPGSRGRGPDGGPAARQDDGPVRGVHDRRLAP